MNLDTKVGFIGVGKLGKDVSEVMAEHYDIVGYDIHPVKTSIPMAPTMKEAVSDRDIIFVAVPTPHLPRYDGREPTSHLPPQKFDMSIVKQVFLEMAPHVCDGALVALISTALPGETRRASFRLGNARKRLVYNPYFIAQGTVKWDMKNPEMVILGTEKDQHYDRMVRFYEPIVENNPRFIRCTFEEGEAIKVFYNTFITMKLCFVNMVQDVAQTLQRMNVDVVTKALADSDMRLMSTRYMTAGLGDGGGCHPRDNIALSALAKELDLGYDFFGMLMKIREVQAMRMAEFVCSQPNGHDVVIVGRSFKPGVDQDEGSPSILVGYYIESLGRKVHYEKAPHDYPCIYLMGHPNLLKSTKFNEGSTIIDPWRDVYIGQAIEGMMYIPYGM